MASNIERLGNVLAGRMKKTADGAVQTNLELGTINSNLSLSADSLGTPIPRGDYMIPWNLAAGEDRTLQAGDRVLVAWCGNEPVIISIVVPS